MNRYSIYPPFMKAPRSVVVYGLRGRRKTVRRTVSNSVGRIKLPAQLEFAF